MGGGAKNKKPFCGFFGRLAQMGLASIGQNNSETNLLLEPESLVNIHVNKPEAKTTSLGFKKCKTFLLSS